MDDKVDNQADIQVSEAPGSGREMVAVDVGYGAAALFRLG